jgi:hypothetical protein
LKTKDKKIPKRRETKKSLKKIRNAVKTKAKLRCERKRKNKGEIKMRKKKRKFETKIDGESHRSEPKRAKKNPD